MTARPDDDQLDAVLRDYLEMRGRPNDGAMGPGDMVARVSAELSMGGGRRMRAARRAVAVVASLFVVGVGIAALATCKGVDRTAELAVRPRLRHLVSPRSPPASRPRHQRPGIPPPSFLSRTPAGRSTHRQAGCSPLSCGHVVLPPLRLSRDGARRQARHLSAHQGLGELQLQRLHAAARQRAGRVRERGHARGRPGGPLRPSDIGDADDRGRYGHRLQRGGRGTRPRPPPLADRAAGCLRQLGRRPGRHPRP